MFYKILLKDYKNSYDKLKRPFLKNDYYQFLKEKEEPIKFFFQYLKEFVVKCLTASPLLGLDLSFLVKSDEDCSFFDILRITNDYSLKFNIFYLFVKMQNPFFFEKVSPSSIKNTYLEFFYDFIILYSDDKHMKWMNFNGKQENFSFLEYQPRIVALQKNKEIRLADKDFKEENGEKKLFDLEEIYKKYLESIEKDKLLLPNPNGFIEFLLNEAANLYPDLNLSYKHQEEIKLAINFFYFGNFNNPKDLDEKNNKFYFFLFCFISYENTKIGNS